MGSSAINDDDETVDHFFQEWNVELLLLAFHD